MFLMGILRETALLTAAMAPYLLLGFAVAGVLKVLFPVSLIMKHLGKRKFSSVLKAAILGVPLPLCSCGVIAPAAALRRQGASRGATLSFLVSTPTSGADSILATYALMGWAFTLYRVAASFLLGLISGSLANLQKDNLKPQEAGASPCSVCGLPGVHKHSVWEKVKSGTLYAISELPGDIGKWLIIGLVAGGIISYAVNPSMVQGFASRPWLVYPIMVAVAVPLYVCATGSIPIAAALIGSGLSPGAALVFLVAGPATNTATVGVVGKLLGKWSLTVYLGVIIAGSIVLGLIMDWLNHGLAGVSFAVGAGPQAPSWWEWALAGVLVLMLLWALGLRPLLKKISASRARPDLLLRVPNMTCAHCVATIERCLSDMEGVEGVWISLKDKTVGVKGGEPEAIEKAIRDAGYEVHGTEP